MTNAIILLRLDRNETNTTAKTYRPRKIIFHTFFKCESSPVTSVEFDLINLV